MRKLVYYVSVTLDGYIAGPGGSFDFFPFADDLAAVIVAENPETIPVHGRGPLGIANASNKRFDTVLMGRHTYEVGLPAGITSPYPHLTQYVVSRTLTATDPAVEVVTDASATFVRDLKSQEGLDIWLCGGGKLAATLRDQIDEIIIKRHPIVTGSGIPLFDGPFAPACYAPASARDLPSGVTITTYTRKPTR
ncbi:dihydrofolate reductase family protein [Sphaerisporangium sp. B11E5]|uniref:dihydrofolate reductase family protein n=1 Tax=Sphaerisporangium sp. B11E5 TaxID=3153563 RepID=UPI00325CFE63